MCRYPHHSSSVSPLPRFLLLSYDFTARASPVSVHDLLAVEAARAMQNFMTDSCPFYIRIAPLRGATRIQRVPLGAYGMAWGTEYMLARDWQL